MTRLKFRKLKSEDRNFIFETWLKGNREVGVFKKMHPDIYFPELRRILMALDCPVIVCCNPEDEDQIFGFMVARNHDTSTVIHYVFVKSLYRRMQVASKLIEEFGTKSTVFYTHMSQDWQKFITGLGDDRRYFFNPYLFPE